MTVIKIFMTKFLGKKKVIFNDKDKQEQRFQAELAMGTRKAPFTMGLEIEQPRILIEPLKTILVKGFYQSCRCMEGCTQPRWTSTGKYNWCQDLSGPWEMQLGPARTGSNLVKKFVEYCRKNQAMWRWTSQRGNDACGSHLHFRIDEELFDNQYDIDEAWAVLWNTLVELQLMLFPLFAFGKSTLGGTPYYKFRDRAGYYATLFTTRYKTSSFKQIRDNANNSGIRSTYRQSLIINPKQRNKPLTVELRIPETHPSISYFTMNTITIVMREALKTELSPKMTKETHRRIVPQLQKVLDGNGLGTYSTNLWTILKEIKDINFTRVAMGRRRGMKTHYDDYIDMFFDYLTVVRQGTTHRAMRRIDDLFSQYGLPPENPKALWNVFVPEGQFAWDQADIVSNADNTGGVGSSPNQEQSLEDLFG